MYIRRINHGSWDDGIYYYKDPNHTILHREDGPAVEYANGDKCWYLNDKLHREDGPAIEYANGDKVWYINGECHREDGPAIEYTNGEKHWFFNGKLHREDGPAVELSNGNKFYYVNDWKISKEEYIEHIKSKPICPSKKSRILKRCT